MGLGSWMRLWITLGFKVEELGYEVKFRVTVEI